MVPTIERRGEGSPTERGAGWRSTGPCCVVAVEGGAPAGQGLGLALLHWQSAANYLTKAPHWVEEKSASTKVRSLVAFVCLK